MGFEETRFTSTDAGKKDRGISVVSAITLNPKPSGDFSKTDGVCQLLQRLHLDEGQGAAAGHEDFSMDKA